MSQTKNVLKCMMRLTLLASVGFAAFLLLAQTNAALAVATVPSLGNADPFAVLGGSTVTNTGLTTITGDLGVSLGTACTGFPAPCTGVASGTVTGTIHAADPTAANAQTANATAYGILASEACDFGPFGPTDLAGQTLAPGVYCYSSTVQNSGVLTLNGGPTDVWVFRIGDTLTTGPGSSVLFTGGGQDCNVFWQVGSSATLGTDTAFIGNILALTSITLNHGASVSGRALAQNGAVTLDTNNVAVCHLACPLITLLPAPPLPQGTVGVAYNQTITATGGTGSYTFSVTAGALPTGLLPLTSGGLISGTPTTAGTFTFTVTATDTCGTFGVTSSYVIIFLTKTDVNV